MWGKPGRRETYSALDRHIDVLKWDAETTGGGTAVYATLGASAASHDGHRVEFVIGLFPEENGVEGSLAALATFPLLSGPIGPGETVTLPDALLPGSDCRTYLMVPEGESLIDTLMLDDGSHVEFLQVLPIHESELELKRQYGAKWLVERISGQLLRMSDPFRKPIQHPYVPQ